jgi:REP element-mobilizing transposase RayT
VFFDDADREDYIAILERVITRMEWRCLSYCLMDNHLHLLLEIAQPNLGAGIQRLHGFYGSSFNERHGRTGHIFQGRFGSTLITSDEQLWWTIAYIVHNPVEAGLCKTAAGWRWSSHRAVLDEDVPAWLDRDQLLRCFAPAGGEPLQRYRQLTAGA